MAKKNVKIGYSKGTVEVDGACVSKRKFNKGRRVGNLWCVGGICRDTRKFFFDQSYVRDSAALDKIVTKNVKKGTNIMTDRWRGYNNLKNIGYKHAAVNHNLYFVDPINPSIHTQNIENLRNHLKKYMKGRSTDIKKYLREYIGEYKFLKSKTCSFSEILLGFSYLRS